MFHWQTKQELFEALDNPEVTRWLKYEMVTDLKYQQDACMLHILLGLKAAGKIAEIGGGVSRTLPAMQSLGWQCVNVEPWQGVGNGPKRQQLPGITNVPAYLGQFCPDLKDNSFYCVYSISVLEHISNDKYILFFEDLYRIMKFGGMSWHAIDAFITDEPDAFQDKKIIHIYNAARKAGFELLIDEPVPDSVFKSSYISISDIGIRNWYKFVSELFQKAKGFQVCSLLLGIKKPTENLTHYLY